jgi:hypothetical protein
MSPWLLEINDVDELHVDSYAASVVALLQSLMSFSARSETRHRMLFEERANIMPSTISLRCACTIAGRQLGVHRPV